MKRSQAISTILEVFQTFEGQPITQDLYREIALAVLAKLEDIGMSPPRDYMLLPQWEIE